MEQKHCSLSMFMSIKLSMMVLFMIDVSDAQYAPLMEDNVAIRTEILGLPYPKPKLWMDSYSDGTSCYCNSTFDHNVDLMQVDTPLGKMSIPAVCKLLGEGPRGSVGRPRYNDIQCGNGPISDTADEIGCPGRIEHGQEGCKYIGPKWNFSKFIEEPKQQVPIATKVPTKAPIRTTKVPTKSPTRVPVATKKPTNSPVAPVATKIPTKVPLATKKPTGVPLRSNLRTRAPINAPLSTFKCRITQLDLWNGAIDTLVIPKMYDGMNICTSLEMNVDAVSGTCVKYVKFTLTGSPNMYTYKKDETYAPFFLYGNSGRLVHGSKLTEGVYTLTATPNDDITAYTKITFNVIKC